MSQANIDRLRSGYEGLNQTGEWPSDGLLSADFELHRDPFVETADVPPGPDAPAELMRRLSAAMRDITLETERFIEAPGGEVVVVLRILASGKASGIALNKEQAHVWSFRGDTAVGMQIYGQLSEAQRAVGLSD